MADEWDGSVDRRRRPDAGDVADARAAVVATSRSLDRIADLLHRHFRALMLALVTAATVAALLIYLVAEVKAVVHTVETQARLNGVQELANEVEVLRHRVHSKESDQRLCAVLLNIALKRPLPEAEVACAPVLGPEFATTRDRLVQEERRLAELREELGEEG